jgi:hypothetical protein
VAAEIDRQAWARVVAQLAAQESAGNKTLFAATIGVDRRTVIRWIQAQVAVSEESVRTVARKLGLQARDLLVQVGYYQAGELPAAAPTERRVAQEDEAIKLVRESDAPPSLKRELIEHLTALREEHERQRLAEAQRSLKLGMRGRRNVG